MTLLARLLVLADRVSEPRTAYAHCDLPCGVYDPVQAKVEADSVKAVIEKYERIERAFPYSGDLDQGAASGACQTPPLGPLDRLLQARPPREVPSAARPVLEGDQGRWRLQAHSGRGCSRRPPPPDRRDRPHLLGDQEGLNRLGVH